jgi:hypothetical protein
MKKLLIIAVTFFTFISCTDDEKELITHDITIKCVSEELNLEQIKDVIVTITNTETNKTQKDTSDAQGMVGFTLEQGAYDIFASATVKSSSTVDTIAVEEEVNISGSMNNKSVIADQNIELELAVASGSGLVISEVYYTGTKTPNNKSYWADWYIEIYNNSDSTIYADGLCYGVHAGLSSTKANIWVKKNGEILDKMPLSMITAMIPGSGKENPIEPGKSIIIACDAINHKNDTINPNSPVDLTDANFECYFETSGKDADYAAPNMKILYSTSTKVHDALLTVFGPGLVLYKFPENINVEEYLKADDSYMTRPGSKSTTKYMLIDPSWIVDGVEALRSAEATNKRLHPSVDAGYIFDPNGTYTGKSIRRKVKKIVNDKVIYFDRNNAILDFMSDQIPTPNTHPTTVD